MNISQSPSLVLGCKLCAHIHFFVVVRDLVLMFFFFWEINQILQNDQTNIVQVKGRELAPFSLDEIVY